MKKRASQALAVLMAAGMLFLTACNRDGALVSDPGSAGSMAGTAGDTSRDESTPPGDTSLSEPSEIPDYNEEVFPIFPSEYTGTRGGDIPEAEDYLDYKAYLETQHTFSDMIDHEAEVAAVRLAQLGAFEKTETFTPDGTMTVMEVLRAFFAMCRIDAGERDDEILQYALDKQLIGDGVQVDYESAITREFLAYLMDRAVEDVENTQQYKLLVNDFDEISEPYKEAVLQTIALGITECSGDFQPAQAADRATIALSLYRAMNPGARVIPLYDMGSLYTPQADTYLIKSTYEKNPTGVQLGFFTNYNHQSDAFEAFGKRTIDRTEFYKWVNIEKTKGVYTMPNFSNDKSAHKAGTTVISCIDISANRVDNPAFDASNIPPFYTQDINDPATRTAAKQFLYAFVQKMLSEISGDVILAIDYELDWQQAIYNTAEGRSRAEKFARWFVEACEVARQAAREAGASSRLSLMAIYNNITPTHLLGPENNAWMIDIANAVDCVGIDSYQFYDDKTDPSYTIQNIRFLINNYSLGKPVYVVENGLGILRDFSVKDEVTGLNQMQLQTAYNQNLFRAFRFALEKGDFLNANLSGYLIWSLKDTNQTSEKTYGILNSDGSYRDSGKAVLRGFQLLEKQRQFNPSRLTAVADASQAAPEINVSSGCDYDKLSYITTAYSTSTGKGTFRIKLAQAGTVCISVNGTHHYAATQMTDVQTFEIEGLQNGLNVIDIYFGSEATPFTQSVEAVLLS